MHKTRFYTKIIHKNAKKVLIIFLIGSIIYS